MIFRKIKKTYRKYFREKKIIEKEKLKDKSLEILFFIQYQSVSRCVQPETSRSIQYPRQCACCRGDKKGVLYVHEFQRREIALSRWRGEISIFFAAISKTLLTPRDTNDSYPMPDSMARVISRFLHVRASTVSIISMFLISHQMSWTKWHRFLRVYIYKLPSYISLYKNRH